MLLAVDTGNTETVIGLFDGATLLDHWRVSTNAERTSDEMALLIQEFLAFHGFSFDTDVAGLAVCSGVPRVTAALRDMSERYFGFPALVLEAGIRTGMPILYENPKDVAPDRIANAVGALDVFDPPLVIVDFSSTATIFDAITGKGEYLGGVIVPGIEIGLDAMVGRAAMLRDVELLEPRSVIGRNSQEAIQSGVVHGMGALIDGVVDRMAVELGSSTVVATGRLADLMEPFCERIEHVDPWLTLRGLRLIFEKNRT
ncbi:MAG: type III pantothenate kinase [Acidobacteria bacterium]|nr:type III pantothenate kinase [Acidobacteriota bacterium]